MQGKPDRYRAGAGSTRIRCQIGLALLLAVIGSGTLGFRLIEGWDWLDSLYMTVITITTVGFKEVRVLSQTGQIFTIVLIVFGVGTVAYSASGLLESLVQRQIRLLKERFGMQKDIDRMCNHIIVCGYGLMGRLLVADLLRAKRDLVVVESEAAVAEELERGGVPFVQGNATEEEVLAQAGIQRAEALVATLANDADNLFLTLTARGMKRDLHIVVRAENPGVNRKFAQAGADHTVSPYVTGAHHIVQLLTRPAIIDFVEFITKEEDVQLEVQQIEIASDSPFAGKTLGEARVRQATGHMVLAVKRPNVKTIFDPSSNTRIHVGDVLIAVGKVPQADASPAPR